MLIITYHQAMSCIFPVAIFGTLVLSSVFIWLAENIATFLGAWKYPDQYDTWQIVSFSKISSWFLLVIISVIIVAQLKHVKASRTVQKS